MHTAQMNSPRFDYQLAVPAAHTLDEYRVVSGSYGGSFSRKSNQPLWIAVAMIAAVAGIGYGVNFYADYNAPKVEPTTYTPDLIVKSTPPASTSLQAPTPAPESQATLPKSDAANMSPAVLVPTTKNLEPNNSVNSRTTPAAKPAPAATSKVSRAPASGNVVVPVQPEIAPPLPPIIEPLPTPAPIVDEIPPVPAPKPVPETPPVEAPKQ